MTSPAISPGAALVGANLDREIAARGLTNRAVGDMIGATEHQVWRWRRARVEPSTRYAMALAAVLFDGDVAALYEAAA